MLLPVLAVCGLGAWQVLLVAWALVAAGDAAHAGRAGGAVLRTATAGGRARAAGFDAQRA